MAKKAERKTNKEFAREDKNFAQACSEAGVEPTARQASKFRNGKGAAKRGAR